MEDEKRIDESWKEKAEKERLEQKTSEPQETQASYDYQKPDFNFFITTMSMQAMIALGKIENPLSNKLDKNLNQARFIIDTLDMLKEKTSGNLTKEEDGLLTNIVSDLKMVYAQEAGV